MKLSTSFVALPLMLALGAGAQAACIYPQAPQKLPNGGQATKEEMLAAQGEVKAHLLLAGATGVPQGFYRRFAEYASRRTTNRAMG